ncbi:MAG: SAF domain-containing protein, partial [Nocardioidaceae bacterium]
MDQLRRTYRRFRRAVLARRRLLAALCAAGAVAAGLQATSVPPPATASVLTAARDLPAGAVLGAGDL